MISMSIQIIVACDGTHFTLPVTCAPKSLIDVLRPSIALHTDISTHDQILLTRDGKQLDHRCTFNEYTLTDSKLPIFVFSKRWLKGHVTGASLLSASAYDFSHAEDEAPANAPDASFTRILLDYCALFRWHSEHTRLFVEGGLRRAEACRETQSAILRQLDAIDVLSKNLKAHVSIAVDAADHFLQGFSNHCRNMSIVEQGFERDLSHLAHIELHPTLKSGTQKNTLLDFMHEGKLRSYLSRCLRHHFQLKAIADNVRLQVKKLHADVDAELAVNVPKAVALNSSLKRVFENVFCLLNYEITECETACKQQRELADRIEQDSAGAQEHVNKLTHTMPDSVHTLVTELRAANANHIDSMFPEFCRLDGVLRDAMTHIAVSQNNCVQLFHERLKVVSDIQSRVRQMRSRLVFYEESLNKKSKELSRFDIASKIPDAYYASLFEVVRRRRYSSVFMTIVSECAQRLTDMRAKEINTRMLFARQYGKYLPRELISGLNERPPQCEIQTRNFDHDLPEIYSLTDIDIPSNKMISDTSHHSGQEKSLVAKSSELALLSIDVTGSQVALQSPHAATPIDDAKSGSLVVATIPSSCNTLSTLDGLLHRVHVLQFENDTLRKQLKDTVFTESTCSFTSNFSTSHFASSFIPDETNESLVKHCDDMKKQLLLVKQEHVQQLEDFDKQKLELQNELANSQQMLSNLFDVFKRGQDRNSMSSTHSSNLHNSLIDNQCEIENGFTSHKNKDEKKLSLLKKERIEKPSLSILEQKLNNLAINTAYMFQEHTTLMMEVSSLRTNLNKSICLTSFPVGRLALFHMKSSGYYECVNQNEPNYFLSSTSLSELKRIENKNITHFIGRVKTRETNTVLPNGVNPYNLEIGTIYHALTVSLDDSFIMF